MSLGIGCEGTQSEPFPSKFQRLHSITGNEHPVCKVSTLERVQGERDVVRIVFDKQNFGAIAFTGQEELPPS